MSINGGSTVNASGINATTIDNAYCASCSPIKIKVTETDNGGNRTATVEVKSIGAPPSGTYRLMVAVAEKTVNYNAPNSESVHHNVFRQFLTATAGDALPLAAQGSQTTVNFNYSISSNWVANEVYVLAWLFNENTNAVLNSGTKFDEEIIPIELSTWKGTVLGSINQLNWTTLTERNTRFFEIERSNDGKTFAVIGQIKAAGNSLSPIKYDFDDEKPLPSIGYYRLKTIDLDGSSSVSNTLTLIRNGQKAKDLNVFPSPTNNILHVFFISNNDKATNEWRILDGFGKLVQTFSRPAKASNNDEVMTETLDISHLTPGLYLVQLIQNNEISTTRFVKN